MLSGDWLTLGRPASTIEDIRPGLHNSPHPMRTCTPNSERGNECVTEIDPRVYVAFQHLFTSRNVRETHKVVLLVAWLRGRSTYFGGQSEQTQLIPVATIGRRRARNESHQTIPLNTRLRETSPTAGDIVIYMYVRSKIGPNITFV